MAERIRDVEKQLTDAIGNDPRPHRLILMKAAAEETVIAEKARADYLAGRPVRINDVVQSNEAMLRTMDSLQLLEAPDEADAPPAFIISATDLWESASMADVELCFQEPK